MRQTQLAQYLQWLSKHRNLDFIPDDFDPATFDFDHTAGVQDLYQALWQWSVDQPGDFWQSVWDYFEVISHSPARSALADARMPGARWFEGATLNYAEHVFRQKSAQRPAILYGDERRPLQEISWAELARQTAAFAAFLRASGVGRGDRVAAYLPNSPHAIVAALATLSLGAVWSSCSPDFGAGSVADRFVQIQPKVLLATDGYTYNGKSFDKIPVVQELRQLLPGLEKVVIIPFLNEKTPADAIPGAVHWADALATPAGDLQFEAVPFDHPLWILYSSGTTGAPKAITHGHGGNLLEHLKYLHFHNDVHPGERFFWYSTTGWMMWNFTFAALLSGATIVLYDGSPAYPDLNALWAFAEKSRITHFGTSAPFLVSCMKAGLSPGRAFDLSALRSIGSTGSPLPPEAFDWVFEHVRADLWLSSMAGGTDVCTAWVGGNPLLPVYRGEIQCRCLGCAMESWSEAGAPVPAGEVGEMVVTKPMPSMPVYFWNDPGNKKYIGSYFEHFPGVWRHGDWLQISARNSVVILGRSDATLNRQGVRIGTAEIYRALDQIREIRDSLIVNLEKPDGSDWMPLFVALQPGSTLDDALRQQIKKTLRDTYSPRHVPDEILLVQDIPYTISGKKMETPVKRILLGQAPEKVFTRDSMKNPESMDFFIALAARTSGA